MSLEKICLNNFVEALEILGDLTLNSLVNPGVYNTYISQYIQIKRKQFFFSVMGTHIVKTKIS